MIVKLFNSISQWEKKKKKMLLEGTASYATLLMLFFGHFLVVTSVTFNNSLSNFEE